MFRPLIEQGPGNLLIEEVGRGRIAKGDLEETHRKDYLSYSHNALLGVLNMDVPRGTKPLGILGTWKVILHFKELVL